MTGFISALTGTDGISASTFYTVLTDMVPLLVIMIPVALGIYFVRRAVKGASKAKARI